MNPLWQGLGRWVARADRLHDLGQRHWQRWSPFERALEIAPYRGFGTLRRLEAGGRVLRQVAYRAPQASDPAWRNLVEVYKRMASGEVPRARVRARLGALAVETEADDEGHFSVQFELARPLAVPGWHRVEFELLAPSRSHEPVRAVAEALVPPATARFGVISDLDDTVLVSEVRHRLRMLALLLRSNARTRLPFPGVGAFYRALERGASGAEGNPVCYVSSSPWNLYTPLSDFLTLQGLPEGPLMLKDFGDHMVFAPPDHRAHKLRCIERVLAAWEHLPFVLIGDSGEQDPEIYRQVAHAHPGRVRAVYIRSVDPEPARIAAVQALAQELHAAGVPLLLAADSEAAARHAAAAGLIAAGALAEVRADRQQDDARPPA